MEHDILLEAILTRDDRDKLGRDWEQLKKSVLSLNIKFPKAFSPITIKSGFFNKKIQKLYCIGSIYAFDLKTKTFYTHVVTTWIKTKRSRENINIIKTILANTVSFQIYGED